jgi:hypothetical protein
MLNPEQRAEIARRNGALSKGPKSIHGKRLASRNAISHGMTAVKTAVLQNENAETWHRVLAAHMEHYRPKNDIEAELVEDIAFCRWRLRRFRGVDTALWDLQMDDQAEAFAQQYEGTDESARLAYAFRTDPNLHLASRYEGRLRRAYEKAIRNYSEQREAASKKQKDQNEPS